jgi:hypothetical protein
MTLPQVWARGSVREVRRSAHGFREGVLPLHQPAGGPVELPHQPGFEPDLPLREE